MKTPVTILAAIAAIAHFGMSPVSAAPPAAASETAGPVFGVGALSSAESAFPPSANASYQIRPGDIITVSVFNEPSLSQPGVRVLPGGTIEEPLAGAVRVGGLTPSQASAAVRHALRKFVRNPDVTVAVAAVAPVDVYVLGNVRTPGKYQMQPDSRLMDALAAAGGLGPTDGDLPDARVSSGAVTQTVSLQRLLHGGDLSLNAPIRAQTTVYVPSPVVFTVQVNGAVDHTGDVPMHEGDRLVNAIARAGTSPNANSDLNRVLITRHELDGRITQQTVNMYDIYKHGDVSKDIVLVKGDTVFVPQGTGRHNASDAINPLTSILFGLTRL